MSLFDKARSEQPRNPRLRISCAVHDSSDARYTPDSGDRVTDKVKAFRDKYRSLKLSEQLKRNRSVD